MTEYPSSTGLSKPMATHSTSCPGSSGCNSIWRMGSQSRNGVSCKAWPSQYSARSNTCPRPNATDAGYSSATGHSASSTSVPRACGTNQRSRKRLQCAVSPSFITAQASSAPSALPVRGNSHSLILSVMIAWKTEFG